MIVVPPKVVFELEVKPKGEKLSASGYDVPGFTKVSRSDEGEMLSYFDGYALPRKGLVYPEAVEANNLMKRFTVSYFLPFASYDLFLSIIGFALTPYHFKKKFLDKLLQTYTYLADSVYTPCERCPYLKFEYYNNCSKALWLLTENFLLNLGINPDTSKRMGKIVATLIEYDDAYRVRVEDLFSETSQELLMKNPRKEFLKLLKIYKNRECNFQSNMVGEKVLALLKIFSFILLLPKVKKAFVKALEKVEYNWLRLDKYEIYWNLNRNDYDILGESFEKRFKVFCNYE